MTPEDDVDLTNCDREPIHILGRVQYFGALLAIDDDWQITHASENAEEILGFPAQDMIGALLQDFLPQQTIHDLANEFMAVAAYHETGRLFRFPLFGDARDYDVAIHRSGQFMVLEFEQRLDPPSSHDDQALMMSLIRRVRQQKSIETLANEAAKATRTLSGFDRVMVYRFNADGSGSVIAEQKRAGLESFDGLRFPASDIPKQARALYVRNLLRIISDVDGATPAILPPQGGGGSPLDLSLATTRAVSTIHLEYLRNMGVKASMSVSLVRDGELWGLIACHNNKPRHLSLEQRATIELFAQMINYEFDQSALKQEVERASHLDDLQTTLRKMLGQGRTETEIFSECVAKMGALAQFAGAAVVLDGQVKPFGDAPGEAAINAIVACLETRPVDEVFATSHLIKDCPMLPEDARDFGGVIAIPVLQRKVRYLLLFRRVFERTRNWAGNPEKPVEHGPHGDRLTPRKSFEAWAETVVGQSASWFDHELRAAEAVRVMLKDVVFELDDDQVQVSRRSQRRQELLIAELNHRVRNILNLIRGLMSQVQKEGVTLDDYSAQLDARIQAIAIAHDQLTEKNWDWISLSSLIRNETTAFAKGQSARVIVTGPDIDLSPAAATTLVLVIHELVTNSVKYGALSDPLGEVAITLDVRPEEGCFVSWDERNGPPVNAPARKGFGTAIVLNSIPFELKGEADVEFRVTGLVARFRIPSRHARRGAMQVDQVIEADAPAALNLTSKTALVLEDNMIIAMDAQNILEAIGFETVHVTSRISEALDLLGHAPPDFALLDVNVDDELSYPVAQRCTQLGIPVLVASGYGNSREVFDRFEGVPVVKKPYTRETIEDALRRSGL